MTAPKGARMDIPALRREVDEYFDIGVSVKPGDTVFDVGANIGMFALLVAERCAGDVELHCFEPIPPIFAALEQNVRDNPMLAKSKVRLHNLGLTSDTSQREIEFNYFRNNPTDSTYDLDSKRKEFEQYFETLGARVGGKLGAIGPVGRGVAKAVASMPRGPVGRFVGDKFMGRETVRCQLRTMSEIIEAEHVERIDVLKIDVEGAELHVLQGISDEHWPRVRSVVLEGHDHDDRRSEIVELMTSHGLTIEKSIRPSDQAEMGMNNFVLIARATA